jgi:hypothetical protein
MQLFFLTALYHDRNYTIKLGPAVSRKTSIESEKNASSLKFRAQPPRKPSPRQKAGRVRNPASKPKTGRANKKAEVIPMMKRAKGATLTEIIAAMK